MCATRRERARERAELTEGRRAPARPSGACAADATRAGRTGRIAARACACNGEVKRTAVTLSVATCARPARCAAFDSGSMLHLVHPPPTPCTSVVDACSVCCIACRVGERYELPPRQATMYTLSLMHGLGPEKVTYAPYMPSRSGPAPTRVAGWGRVRRTEGARAQTNRALQRGGALPRV